jgi:hypothetical protein
MINRNYWVYDIETLKSCFTYSAINVDTEEIVQYVIHKDRSDYDELIKHLESCKGQIGFNNINFDYPIIHNFIKCVDGSMTRINTIDFVYGEAQRIIEEQNKVEFNATLSIKSKNVLIPQLDLFKLWHYNNKARRTSLKALEISMNYPNVMEMPIDHKRDDIRLDEIPSILEYNLNDVLATYEFYKRSLEKIDLRKELIKKYNIPCTNFSDSKIGEQLVLKLYCEKTGRDFWEVKELRTYRPRIDVNNLILPYINFKTKEFDDLLTFYKEQSITKTKGDLDYSVILKGFKYDFKSGGLHGCIKSGVYYSDDQYVIIDLDVASLYPSIGVLNELYPQHLGKAFCSIYKDILDQRVAAKKEGNMAISDALKLALNSVFGKSNDIHSFLFDPLYTMTTTVNGQLLLGMLAERLVLSIEDMTILQVNTDGITVRINKDHLELYYTICKHWERLTKLTLEFVEYQKMWIADVNNYGALTTTGKIKNKGKFEVEKMVGNEMAYHKDNSFKIIPIALERYFAKNIPIEETILKHDNIYDFCGRQKFTQDSYGETHTIKYDNTLNPYDYCEKQQRNTRYYISKPGVSFIKQYKKGTSEVINKGFQVTIFNNYIEQENYNIDYSYYIKECNKIIDVLETKQLELF